MSKVMGIVLTRSGAIARRYYNWGEGGVSGTYLSQANGYSSSDFTVHWLEENRIDPWDGNGVSLPPEDYGKNILIPHSEYARTLDLYCDSVAFDDTGIIAMSAEKRAALLATRNLSGDGTKANPYKNLCFALAKAHCIAQQYSKCTECISYIRIVVTGTVDYHVRLFPVDVDGTALFDMNTENLSVQGDGRIIIDGAGASFSWNRSRDAESAGAMFCTAHTLLYNINANVRQVSEKAGFVHENYEDHTHGNINKVSLYNCKIITESEITCTPIQGQQYFYCQNTYFKNSFLNGGSGYGAVVAYSVYNCQLDQFFEGYTETAGGFKCTFCAVSSVNIQMNGGCKYESKGIWGSYCFNCSVSAVFYNIELLDDFTGVDADVSVNNNVEINIVSAQNSDSYLSVTGYKIDASVNDILKIKTSSVARFSVFGIETVASDPDSICVGADIDINNQIGALYLGYILRTGHAANCNINVTGTGDWSLGGVLVEAQKINDTIVIIEIDAQSTQDRYTLETTVCYTIDSSNTNVRCQIAGDYLRGTQIIGFDCYPVSRYDGIIQNCHAYIEGQGKCWQRGSAFKDDEKKATLINCSGNCYCWENTEDPECFPYGGEICSSWECAL